MKKGLLILLVIITSLLITTNVNAEELKSTMIKDLDIQIIDLETDGGSFTLLKNIDFTNENAKIDMTIQCINKETSINECAKNNPIITLIATIYKPALLVVSNFISSPVFYMITISLI